MIRTCTKCHETFELTAENFKLDPRYRQGFTTWCLSCLRANSAANCLRNRDRRNAARNARRKANPVKTKADRRRYSQMYREKESAQMREWRARNRAWVNEYMRLRHLNGPVHLTIVQAAEKLGLTTSSIRYALKTGKLTKVLRGTKTLCLAEEVRCYKKRETSLHLSEVRLDATLPSGSGQWSELAADPAAIDPVQRVLAAAEIETVLTWVKDNLTEKQQRVLEAYVAADFDDRDTAHALKLTPGDVRRYLTCIQSRAQMHFGQEAIHV